MTFGFGLRFVSVTTVFTRVRFLRSMKSTTEDKSVVMLKDAQKQPECA